MASMYSRDRYLGELQPTAAVTGTPAQATLLVKADIARQVALAYQSKWRTAAFVLSGAVLYLAFSQRKRWF
jgi:hypothetical protein